MWIGDCFSRDKAEQIPLEALPALFSPPPEMPSIERGTNHFLLGAKGSGKSTILRSLVYPVWSRRAENLADVTFLGVWVPIRYEDADSLRTACATRDSSDLFEHFFVCTVMHELCCQWADDPHSKSLALRILPGFLADPYRSADSTTTLAEHLQHDRSVCLQVAKRTPDSPTSQLDLRCRFLLPLSALQDLAAKISSFVQADGVLPSPRLGLLIDSYDYYSELGLLLLPLFESDQSNPIVVKAAARSIDLRNLHTTTRSRRLEFDRDYSLVTLDRLPDDVTHHQLLANAVVRRVRTLDHDHNFASLQDTEILGLVFHGASGDEDLTSFDSMARLASGNILDLILLLDEAAIVQRRNIDSPQSPRTPLERSSRLAAIESQSRRFWDLELGVRLPSSAVEAKALCEILLDLDGAAPSSSSPAAATFEFEQLPSSEEELFRDLFATRVLVLTDRSLHKTLQAGLPHTGQVSFELHRLLLPNRKRRPIPGNCHRVDWSTMRPRWKRAADSSRPRLSPRARVSQEMLLFPPDFTVFVSLPFDRSKYGRTTVLRTAINRIYRRQTGRDGRPGVSFVDIRFIPQVGSFRFEIPRYVSDANYVVVDVTDASQGPTATPGVFYECGLAAGLLKPFALFYNAKVARQRFDPTYLPEVLRSQTVVVYRAETRNFTQEYLPIHEKLLGLQGKHEHPFGVQESEGALHDPMGRGPYAYLNFQPRHRPAQEWAAREIRRLFPDLQLEYAREWQRGDAASMYAVLQGASITLIDCTQGASAQALELGLCVAKSWKRCLMLFDSAKSRINPVAMFPGSRLGWTDLGSDDTTLLQDALRDVLAGTQHGIRLP